MIKIMVSAGEVSGDIHGAALIQELKKINPSSYIFGMGGPRMRAAGADIRYDLSPRGTVGAVEILKHLPFILFGFSRMKKLLKKEMPDILVLIDYQGFNMMLASYAKKLGIRTAYYIAPQEWLWGTPKGVKKVASSLDKILCIFEDEARIYREAGANAVYVGNPNLDTAKPSMSKEAFCKYLGLNPNFPIFGLFPGSRRQEIDSLLDIVMDSARLIRKAVPNSQFIMSVSSEPFRKSLEKAASSSGFPVAIVSGKSHDVLFSSNVSIASSGTTILEAAILGAPAVSIYKLFPLTYFIAKHIVRIRLKYFNMTNILADREVVPELIQSDCTPEKIASKILSLLTDTEALNKIRSGYDLVRSKLGAPGAVKRAAAEIFSELKGKI